MKKYTVLAGNYGSGKTEISLNLAVNCAKEGKKVLMIDLDIVNPYFRSSEHEQMLKSLGIEVIKPCFANTAVDVPSLPPDIAAAFDGDYDIVIFDAGGDPVGASAIGVFKKQFALHEDETAFYFVINSLRPLQNDIDSIREMIYLISHKARLPVSGLINNTNLANETEIDNILESMEMVDQVAELEGVPVKYIGVREDLLGPLRERLGERAERLLPLHIYMRPAWQDDTI